MSHWCPNCLISFVLIDVKIASLPPLRARQMSHCVRTQEYPCPSASKLRGRGTFFADTSLSLPVQYVCYQSIRVWCHFPYKEHISPLGYLFITQLATVYLWSPVLFGGNQLATGMYFLIASGIFGSPEHFISGWDLTLLNVPPELVSIKLRDEAGRKW